MIGSCVPYIRQNEYMLYFFQSTTISNNTRERLLLAQHLQPCPYSYVGIPHPTARTHLRLPFARTHQVVGGTNPGDLKAGYIATLQPDEVSATGATTSLF